MTQLESLVASIEAARTAYYNGEETLSDAEYDALVVQLEKLSPDHPALGRVGAPVPADGAVTHNRPMLSLDKCHTEAEFLAWALPLHNKGTPFFVEPKYDGVSLSLHYKQGRLVCAATRGDGLVGQDVTDVACRVVGLAQLAAPLTGEVRGELVLPLSQFRKIPDAKHPRNVVVGVLSAKTDEGRTCAPEKLRFYAFDLPAGEGWQTAFALNKPGKVEAPQAAETFTALAAKRDKWDFEADGVVFKVARQALREHLGETAHHPKWAIAWKFPPKQVLATVKTVQWQTAGSGVITPVVVFKEPVLCDGAAIGQATLHNLSTAQALDLCVGCQVEVSRRGGVIPHVEHVTWRPAHVLPLLPPTKCPTCDAKAVTEERPGSQVLVCSNEQCPAAAARRLERWCKAIGADGFGPAVCDALLVSGVRTIAGLYTVDWATITFQSGPDTPISYGIAARLSAALRTSRAVSTDKLLFGLSLPGLGESLCRKLAKAATLEDICDMDAAQMAAAVPGLGGPTAVGVLTALDAMLPTLGCLLREGHIEVVDCVQPVRQGALSGHVLCFTGELTIDRHTAAGMAEAAGAEVVDSVTKRTTVLVAADDTPSTKYQKAQKQGILIWSGADFLREVGRG